MYDIDFFKKVNDTYGHITGDHVLIDVSKNVQSLLNNDEYLIRWGGEEFIVLVKGSEDEIRQKAEKIRHSVEMLELPKVSHITISVGVAIYNGGDYQNTVKCADKALYFAKNNGRNHVLYIIMRWINYALCPPICALRSLAVAPSVRFMPFNIAFLPNFFLMSRTACCIFFSRSSSSFSCIFCSASAS